MKHSAWDNSKQQVSRKQYFFQEEKKEQREERNKIQIRKLIKSVLPILKISKVPQAAI